MGVKDLWQVLSPVCERKSLWELQDKIIAVDLSCWICDSQNIAEFSTQPNMYLRNLFFRTSALLLLGAHPVFVLEGTAPEMKATVMSQRNAARGFTQSQNSSGQANKGKRSRLKSIQKRCCELLECLGVKFIQSDGEAEALCALLNKHRLVDGCISQDSDCFLYGAETVYRNFTTTATCSTGGPGFSVDSYSMNTIAKALGLTRNKLIALSLLCGCDYLQQGVAGVGKESALKFIYTVDDAVVLKRLQEWRDNDEYKQMEMERSVGGCEQCGHIGKRKAHQKDGCKYCRVEQGCIPSYNPRSLSQMETEQRKSVVAELIIRKKALLDPEFPSQEVIDEFLQPNIQLPSSIDTKWEQPNLLRFLRLAINLLNWEEIYAFNKFLPILTRWVLLHSGAGQNSQSCPIYPTEIKRSRTLKGVASYEIKWGDTEGLFDSILACIKDDSEIDSTQIFSTIEPKAIVEVAYPDLVKKYTTQIEEAKKAKRKGKSKSKKETENSKKKCNICGTSKECLCRFTQPIQSEPKPKTTKPEDESKLKEKTKTQKKSKNQGDFKHNDKQIKKKKQNLILKDNKQSTLSPFLSQDQKVSGVKELPLDELVDASLTLHDVSHENEADLSAIVMSIVGEEAYNSFPSDTPMRLNCKKQLILQDENNPENLDQNVRLLHTSEDENATYVPLIDRIKMKNDSKSQKRRFVKDKSVRDEYSSPILKQSKSESPEHPYSPFIDIPPQTPKTEKKRSILKSKAAQRFSASFQAFSRAEPNDVISSDLSGCEPIISDITFGFDTFLNSED